MHFTWDEQKGIVNFVKHKVSFEEAVTIFRDLNILSIYDEEHLLYEERWFSIGLSSQLREIVVVHLFLTDDFPYTIRIISARKATLKKRRNIIITPVIPHEK